MAVETRRRTRTFRELDRVELTTDAHGVELGTRGTVITAEPAYDIYVVDITDEDGRLRGVVTAAGRDLKLFGPLERTPS